VPRPQTQVARRLAPQHAATTSQEVRKGSLNREKRPIRNLCITKCVDPDHISSHGLGRIENSIVDRRVGSANAVGRIAMTRLSESMGDEQERVADRRHCGSWGLERYGYVTTVLRCYPQPDETLKVEVPGYHSLAEMNEVPFVSCPPRASTKDWNLASASLSQGRSPYFKWLLGFSPH
jgi:hypothetical protein